MGGRTQPNGGIRLTKSLVNQSRRDGWRYGVNSVVVGSGWRDFDPPGCTAFCSANLALFFYVSVSLRSLLPYLRSLKSLERVSFCRKPDCAIRSNAGATRALKIFRGSKNSKILITYLKSPENIIKPIILGFGLYWVSLASVGLHCQLKRRSIFRLNLNFKFEP